MNSLGPEIKEQLDATVKKYLTEHYTFESRQKIIATERGFSAEHWRQFADLGWLSVPFSGTYGGADGNIADTVDILRMFGRALVVEPYVSTLGLVGTVITSCSNQDVKDNLLPQFISGEKIGALAFEELHSRGNPAHVGLIATPEENGYQLKGEKITVLNAPQADVFVVSARTSGSVLDKSGISLFLLTGAQPGFDMETYTTVDGHRAANIHFDLTVSQDALLTRINEGYSVLSRAIQHGVLMLCSEAVGVMQLLLEDTIEYTSNRKQFKAPLASFQVLRHRMADMYIELQRASAFLEYVVEMARDNNVYDACSLNLLKAQIGRSGRMIGDSAIQLHGGMGMTDELIVGHAVKRLVAISQLLGNTDFHLQEAWLNFEDTEVEAKGYQN